MAIILDCLSRDGVSITPTTATKYLGLVTTGFNWKRVTKISEELIKESPFLKKLQKNWLTKRKNNSNHTKSWYYNSTTKHCILVFVNDVPEGYIKGRIIK